MAVRTAGKINEWLSGAIHARWRNAWPELADADDARPRAAAGDGGFDAPRAGNAEVNRT